MGTTAPTRGSRTLQRRRIIQRPRLLALLDDSSARVRALVAAAGYGKTTLAEQWVAANGRRSAWFTMRRSAADVAALALGVARACSTIVDGCEVRLREHLRAVSAPDGSGPILAEILCEDLAAWPSDAWLVIDDYQEIAGAREAESFVADLVAGCPLQILLTTRERPSWVSARSILYGKVFEVSQTALAMDTHEAAEVLADWSGPAASGLVALANGWPAVIGLASVSSAEIESGEDATVPESLYRFFAEEVFDALGGDVREGLGLLSVAPVIDRELADELLGEARAESVCGSALDVGILVERDTRLELHPLARSFLEERAVAVPSRSAISTCLEHYRKRRDWDAAFDLVRRNAPDELEGLLSAALDDLLETARLSTIEAWCDFASARGIDEPIVALARAETALRQGRQARAQAYAEAAARSSALAFRALSLAGRAAHLASREAEALDLYRRAEASAPDEAHLREARWNQVMSAVDLDPRTARQGLQRLESGVTPTTPREFVKAVTCSLSLATRTGYIELARGELAWELIPTVGDPLLETSFESIYSGVLALAARYPEALKVASALLDTAQHYRLDFARPHGLVPTAMAHAGLRRWSAAEACLTEASELARESGDAFAELFAYGAYLRLFAQQGRCAAALMQPVPELAAVIPQLRSEVLSSRAFVLAAADRLNEAQQIITDLQTSGVGVECAVLSAAVSAVISLRTGEASALEQIKHLERVAFETGGLDLLVTSYRAVPQLLEVLMRAGKSSERIANLVRRVGDEDVLRPFGLCGLERDPHERLTPREREVYQLVCRGLSNRQIAALLVISPATAKLHVQRVFNKLGVHSRRALAVQAALQRTRLRDVGDP